jgi:hypothetical protein
MFAATQRSLAGLKRSAPGHRFENSYNTSRRNGAQRSVGARIVRIGLAVVAFALGVVFAFIPGPGVLFFALAGALLAPESRRLAIALDWTEVKLRELIRWSKRTWKKLGWFARSVVILVGASLGGAAAWFMWQRFFG